MTDKRTSKRRGRGRRTSFVHLTIHSQHGGALPDGFVSRVEALVLQEAIKSQVRVLFNYASNER